MTQQRKTIYAIALDGHQNHYAQKIGHQVLDHIFAIWIVFLSGSTVSVDGSNVNVLSYPFSSQPVAQNISGKDKRYEIT